MSKPRSTCGAAYCSPASRHITGGCGPGHRRFAKRRASRLFRRLARLDPANAPTQRRYDGYDD